MYLLLTEKVGEEVGKYLVNMEHVHMIYPHADDGTRLSYGEDCFDVQESFDQIARWLSEGK